VQYVQSLVFEISPHCNLCKEHAARCPIALPDRYGNLDTSRPLSDEKILEVCRLAYGELGFRGVIGWHYYNEPLLSWDRIEPLMRRIQEAVPAARFVLWTNGTLIGLDPADARRLGVFSKIFVSNYQNRQWAAHAHEIPGTEWEILSGKLDERALPDRVHSEPQGRCLKPFRELVLDHYGNAHLCCNDFRGRYPLGNVWDVDFREIVEDFTEARNAVMFDPMRDPPTVCRGCRFRTGLGNTIDAGPRQRTCDLLNRLGIPTEATMPTVFIAMPVYDGTAQTGAVAAMFATATDGRRFKAAGMSRARSLLAKNMNNHYVAALNARAQGVTRFAMLHGDTVPQPGWLDILWDEMEATGADLVSAVSPLKDVRGLTSTAVGVPDILWAPRRRLSMHEIYEKLPETFGIEDLVKAKLAEPGDELLANTGCCLVDIRRPWVDRRNARGGLRVFFTITDAIFPLPDGTYKEAVASEDWNFSRFLAAEGGRVVATRKVKLRHYGALAFDNFGPWGSCLTDDGSDGPPSLNPEPAAA